MGTYVAFTGILLAVIGIWGTGFWLTLKGLFIAVTPFMENANSTPLMILIMIGTVLVSAAMPLLVLAALFAVVNRIASRGR